MLHSSLGPAWFYIFPLSLSLFLSPCLDSSPSVIPPHAFPLIILPLCFLLLSSFIPLTICLSPLHSSLSCSLPSIPRFFFFFFNSRRSVSQSARIHWYKTEPRAGSCSQVHNTKLQMCFGKKESSGALFLGLIYIMCTEDVGSKEISLQNGGNSPFLEGSHLVAASLSCAVESTN